MASFSQEELDTKLLEICETVKKDKRFSADIGEKKIYWSYDLV